MPAMDYQAAAVPFASLGRSLLSIRRDQFLPTSAPEEPDQELESFQKHASELLSDLSSSDDHLSLPWLRRLLDAFLICQEEFRVIFLNSKPHLSKPLVDRNFTDFFDRAVKALDLCNAIRDGIDQIRHWTAHLDIVLASLSKHRPFGEGHLRRAKKALGDLALLMIDEKDSSSSSGAFSHRNRSFGRNTPKDSSATRKGHFRSLSWSVSRSWSASKQLQAIGSNLNAPRGNEVSQTHGLAVPVYTMNSVLLLVMWTLVAAIPCQDRGGLQSTHFSIPRSFSWAAAVTGLHEKTVEESKKKERKGSSGLLKEVHLLEKGTRNLAEMLDSVQLQLPLDQDKEGEVGQLLEELAGVSQVLKEGLDPLEKQVRDIFYRIVRSRTEGLDCMGKSHATTD